MISPMYARIIIQNWRIVCPFSSNLANNAWSFSFFSLANNSFSIDKSGRKIRQGNFRDGRVIRDNFFTSMVTWPVSANHVISKDPPRARTSLFINYVRSVHIPVHIKRSSILFFFFDNRAIKIDRRIDRKRGKFPFSFSYSNRYRGYARDTSFPATRQTEERGETNFSPAYGIRCRAKINVRTF